MVLFVLNLHIFFLTVFLYTLVFFYVNLNTSITYYCAVVTAEIPLSGTINEYSTLSHYCEGFDMFEDLLNIFGLF